MDKQIKIKVRNRIAYSPRAKIVCGNSGYSFLFDFDEEWADYDIKTALILHNGKKQEIKFSGSVCELPVFANTRYVTVGVYAGDLRTTTPASVDCDLSILCVSGGAEEGGDIVKTAVYIPQVSEDGVLSWANDAGLENPDPVVVRGKDYILTDIDKEEIAGMMSAYFIAEGESF